MKIQATEWEVAFYKPFDKGLVSRTYKKLSKLSSKHANNTIRKWTEDMKRHFIVKDIQM